MKVTKNALATIGPKDIQSTGTELSIGNFGKGFAVLSVMAIILAIAVVFMVPQPRFETAPNDTPLLSPNYCCATIVAEISSR
jgi:hypothetical protein